MPASSGRPTLLRLCRHCQRVVVATSKKLLHTKLKAAWLVARRFRSGTYDGPLMPTPPNERQSLEAELAEILSQIAADWRSWSVGLRAALDGSDWSGRSESGRSGEQRCGRGWRRLRPSAASE